MGNNYWTNSWNSFKEKVPLISMLLFIDFNSWDLHSLKIDIAIHII